MVETNPLTELQDDLDLWVREPDSNELDKSVVAARLCSCDDVCLAVIEDDIG